MSAYTGPVVVVPFIGTTGDAEFAVTFHVSVDDPEAIKQIIERYAEDGYKPDQKRTRRYFMTNGSIEPYEPTPGPIGFPSRSAFLRA